MVTKKIYFIHINLFNFKDIGSEVPTSEISEEIGSNLYSKRPIVSEDYVDIGLGEEEGMHLKKLHTKSIDVDVIFTNIFTILYTKTMITHNLLHETTS